MVEEPERLFDGIPLSELSELAKQCYHGIKCTIDKYGFLVFHSTSNSGKTNFHTQMKLDETGKLINLGGHYPGQWKSSADTFAELLEIKVQKLIGVRNSIEFSSIQPESICIMILSDVTIILKHYVL